VVAVAVAVVVAVVAVVVVVAVAVAMVAVVGVVRIASAFEVMTVSNMKTELKIVFLSVLVAPLLLVLECLRWPIFLLRLAFGWSSFLLARIGLFPFWIEWQVMLLRRRLLLWWRAHWFRS
jgi:hypothetical protein